MKIYPLQACWPVGVRKHPKHGTVKVTVTLVVTTNSRMTYKVSGSFVFLTWNHAILF
jgi:hypothetical protein